MIKLNRAQAENLAEELNALLREVTIYTEHKYDTFFLEQPSSEYGKDGAILFHVSGENDTYRSTLEENGNIAYGT